MMRSNSFYRHLQDAIVINKQRKARYAKMSNAQSIPISTQLICTEQLLLPVARYFDWQGTRFNRKGIPIIVDDFVSMAAIKDAQAAPTYYNVVHADQLQHVSSVSQQYAKSATELATHHRFGAICQETATMLTRLAAFEAAFGAHFAMLTHLTESIGYAATHAIRYSLLSAGETEQLSRSFLKVQLRGLALAVNLDVAAQTIHRLGVGIIVNDLPVIPFVSCRSVFAVSAPG